MPTYYHFTIQGHLDDHWTTWFDGLTITNGSNGETVLGGVVADQAALHGVLAKIRDLGLSLIAVQPGAATGVTMTTPHSTSAPMSEATMELKGR